MQGTEGEGEQAGCPTGDSNLPETHKSSYSVTVLQHAHLSVGSRVSSHDVN